jgi:hypothetical protein
MRYQTNDCYFLFSEGEADVVVLVLVWFVRRSWGVALVRKRCGSGSVSLFLFMEGSVGDARHASVLDVRRTRTGITVFEAWSVENAITRMGSSSRGHRFRIGKGNLWLLWQVKEEDVRNVHYYGITVVL